MRVIVKAVTGAEFDVDGLEPRTTIRQLKARAGRMQRVQVATLVFVGQVLDDDKTLQDCDVRDGEYVVAICKALDTSTPRARPAVDTTAPATRRAAPEPASTPAASAAPRRAEAARPPSPPPLDYDGPWPTAKRPSVGPFYAVSVTLPPGQAASPFVATARPKLHTILLQVAPDGSQKRTWAQVGFDSEAQFVMQLSARLSSQGRAYVARCQSKQAGHAIGHDLIMNGFDATIHGHDAEPDLAPVEGTPLPPHWSIPSGGPKVYSVTVIPPERVETVDTAVANDLAQKLSPLVLQPHYPLHPAPFTEKELGFANQEQWHREVSTGLRDRGEAVAIIAADRRVCETVVVLLQSLGVDAKLRGPDVPGAPPLPLMSGAPLPYMTRSTSTREVAAAASTGSGGAPSSADAGGAASTHFPAKDPLPFRKVNVGGLRSKLQRHNQSVTDCALGAVAALALTPPERGEVDSLIDVLGQPERYHATMCSAEALDLVRTKVLHWPNEELFPAVDLLRLLVLHTQAARALRPSMAAILSDVLAAVTVPGVSAAVCTTGIRAVCNMQCSARLASVAVAGREDVLRAVAVVAKRADAPEPALLAVATVLLNDAVLRHRGATGHGGAGDGDGDEAKDGVAGPDRSLGDALHAECAAALIRPHAAAAAAGARAKDKTLYRALRAVGTLATALSRTDAFVMCGRAGLTDLILGIHASRSEGVGASERGALTPRVLECVADIVATGLLRLEVEDHHDDSSDEDDFYG